MDVIAELPENMRRDNPLPRVLPLYSSEWSDARAATPEEIANWMEGM